MMSKLGLGMMPEIFCTPLQWESDSLRRKAGSEVEQRPPLAVVQL